MSNYIIPRDFCNVFKAFKTSKFSLKQAVFAKNSTNIIGIPVLLSITDEDLPIILVKI